MELDYKRMKKEFNKKMRSELYQEKKSKEVKTKEVNKKREYWIYLMEEFIKNQKA